MFIRPHLTDIIGVKKGGPLTESERCEYEKLNEKIIMEREDAITVSGFFEDLSKYKKHIRML